ncbi:hypothetical protein BDP55DRAFT_628317 [Colletotrichum godetiae]|uniref:Uncharacterized protein n=1 Tax=Colletotrichum godetiae TaxID=1209918 RepID=A0AAJ0AVS7_9PEZI|nr:uncharacterized protein BDP55DRAFT_628317 [Colletotrichum godetiae]KAK1689765.1 hypothetical protein BDP55DRAFT_628317 [Colletotrichum godetiae]
MAWHDAGFSQDSEYPSAWGSQAPTPKKKKCPKSILKTAHYEPSTPTIDLCAPTRRLLFDSHRSMEPPAGAGEPKRTGGSRRRVCGLKEPVGKSWLAACFLPGNEPACRCPPVEPPPSRRPDFENARSSAQCGAPICLLAHRSLFTEPTSIFPLQDSSGQVRACRMPYRTAAILVSCRAMIQNAAHLSRRTQRTDTRHEYFGSSTLKRYALGVGVSLDDPYQPQYIFGDTPPSPTLYAASHDVG